MSRESWHEHVGDYSHYADPERPGANKLRERCHWCGLHVAPGAGVSATTRAGASVVMHKAECIGAHKAQAQRTQKP